MLGLESLDLVQLITLAFAPVFVFLVLGGSVIVLERSVVRWLPFYLGALWLALLLAGMLWARDMPVEESVKIIMGYQFFGVLVVTVVTFPFLGAVSEFYWGHTPA